jgi:hypothetical protein
VVGGEAVEDGVGPPVDGLDAVAAAARPGAAAAGVALSSRERVRSNEKLALFITNANGPLGGDRLSLSEESPVCVPAAGSAASPRTGCETNGFGLASSERVAREYGWLVSEALRSALLRFRPTLANFLNTLKRG